MISIFPFNTANKQIQILLKSGDLFDASSKKVRLKHVSGQDIEK